MAVKNILFIEHKFGKQATIINYHRQQDELLIQTTNIKNVELVIHFSEKPTIKQRITDEKITVQLA
ncbi:hypothetical protein QQG09_07645 [Melissococcus plutonius]|uniref:Uncharacterized protein n=2 Tax=Melissococcus plutonius TaxID=33970 RepID=F3Y8U0_MELPT|nr:hypothetical protein [Melissococcus plutonius]BAK20918.1 hypothetical protein MPTP_0439 [Melissococcus plutonius ATCC 35311]BAL62671.1 hypothetical protein MPD5_1468 [Melissococcus plutonius DAT561]MCV2498592.1 hypothetical protein [Melissococcus plutonius]MCV2501688.1 hypothetical protein [Melissococcus plutonius]MCV2504740.1 hypothetical protein [Melissococcus plutonius]